ncbi:unnamed protein product [Soboliphyme baturini]|uniref:Uncharacterized protein n=1 Tax=Soboliphyme baturini TaxID=241478 RepID=A0A183IPA5_9BILA|nr:unnamed protein product [Soboliphyme baturini]
MDKIARDSQGDEIIDVGDVEARRFNLQTTFGCLKGSPRGRYTEKQWSSWRNSGTSRSCLFVMENLRKRSMSGLESSVVFCMNYPDPL